MCKFVNVSESSEVKLTMSKMRRCKLALSKPNKVGIPFHPNLQIDTRLIELPY